MESKSHSRSIVRSHENFSLIKNPIYDTLDRRPFVFHFYRLSFKMNKQIILYLKCYCMPKYEQDS